MALELGTHRVPDLDATVRRGRALEAAGSNRHAAAGFLPSHEVPETPLLEHLVVLQASEYPRDGVGVV
jgi:hypothetical protein